MLHRVEKLVPERLFTQLDILMFFIRFVYPILTSTVNLHCCAHIRNGHLNRYEYITYISISLYNYFGAYKYNIVTHIIIIVAVKQYMMAT